MKYNNQYSELFEKHDWFFSHNIDAEYFMTLIYQFIVELGDKVIDVGAHMAFHTIPLAKLVGSHGKVYAFEAIPDLAERLKKTALDFPSVHVINSAVTNYNIASNQPKVPFIQVVETGFEAMSGLRLRLKMPKHCLEMPKHSKTITINVLATTLDMSIPSDEKISFIKIDTEGGDFDVIRGSERILRESKPVIVFEYLGQSDFDLYEYTKEDFFNFFASFGYKLFLFTGESFTAEVFYSHGVFWELWAVHEESKHLSFFENNLAKMALHYVKIQKFQCADTIHTLQKDIDNAFSVLNLKITNYKMKYIKILKILREMECSLGISIEHKLMFNCNDEKTTMYELGKRIALAENAKEYNTDNLKYLKLGFSSPEGWATWNNGHIAIIALGIKDIDNDLVFESSVYPNIVQGRLNSQEALFSVNNQYEDKIVLTETGFQKIKLKIPQKFLINGENEFIFEFQNAMSPEELETGEDTRRLAVAFEWFNISLERDD
jgi:FkbM family methyltransferase